MPYSFWEQSRPLAGGKANENELWLRQYSRTVRIKELEFHALRDFVNEQAFDLDDAVRAGTYADVDRIASHLLGTVMKLCHRARFLAGRKPEAKPIVPIFCQDCGVEVERPTRTSGGKRLVTGIAPEDWQGMVEQYHAEQSGPEAPVPSPGFTVQGHRNSAAEDSGEGTDVEPGILDVELPAEESECRGEACLAHAPGLDAEVTQKGGPDSSEAESGRRSGEAAKVQEGRGELEDAAELLNATDESGESHRLSCRSASLRDPDNASLLSGPPSEKTVATRPDGRGRPRPYVSEKNSDTEDSGRSPQSASSAKSAVPSHRQFVEALPGGT